MADTLYRWDEPTQQWVAVTSVNRIEVKSSGGGNTFSDSGLGAVSDTNITFTFTDSEIIA